MQYKLDLHVHTNHSNDGVSSLEKLIQSAKKRGLSGFAVTDHNQCTKIPDQSGNEFLLIPGCEISTQVGHILALFIKQELSQEVLHKKGLPTLEEATAEIHRCGGIAVWAHPYEKLGRSYTKAQLEQVDLVEIINARAVFKNKAANEQAKALAKKYNCRHSAGSDAHSSKEIGNAYMQVEAEHLDLESVRQALLNGNSKPVLVRHTPHYRKGISQFYKAMRTKNILRILKSMAYVGYCCLLDLKQKN